MNVSMKNVLSFLAEKKKTAVPLFVSKGETDVVSTAGVLGSYLYIINVSQSQRTFLLKQAAKPSGLNQVRLGVVVAD